VGGFQTHYYPKSFTLQASYVLTSSQDFLKTHLVPSVVHFPPKPAYLQAKSVTNEYYSQSTVTHLRFPVFSHVSK